MKESPVRAMWNRVLQHFARILPGAQSVRVALHRARGVKIGQNVWVGYDVVLDTSRPFLITLEDGCVLSMRVTVLAHFRESTGVTIERDAFVGAGALILPNVVIGHGAVVAAGSVVTRSVPPMTMVQGNPAVPVAKCGITLGPKVTLKEFSRNLRPVTSRTPRPAQPTEAPREKPEVAEREP
jgi:acetyltransferase-like isoleucine patch superfamily enzyme